MRNSIVAIILAAGLAACTTTPTAPPVLDLPPATVSDPSLEQWWMAFGDPTLNALVDEALAHNLDLAAAMARVDQARAQYKAAEFTQLPDVNIGAGASRSRFSLADNPPLPFGTSAISSNFNVNLNASYELDLWGKYRMATNAAQNNLLASEYARETVRTGAGRSSPPSRT